MACRSITTMALFLPAPTSREQIWAPSADVYRSPCGWLIKLDLAGVRQGDVHIELNGTKLTISGLKEKVLAARRAGIRRVILPKSNEGDLRELPDHVRAEMEFILANQIKEVLIAAIPELAKGLMAAQAA